MPVHRRSPRAFAAALPPPSLGIEPGLASGPIFQTTDVLGAMSTAKELASRFDTMTYDLAFAMGADRCHRMYRAFKAVKDHRATVSADELKGLIVVISAHFAFRHGDASLLQQSSPTVEPLSPTGPVHREATVSKQHAPASVFVTSNGQKAGRTATPQDSCDLPLNCGRV
jgi:hypothetical protein